MWTPIDSQPNGIGMIHLEAEDNVFDVWWEENSGQTVYLLSINDDEIQVLEAGIYKGLTRRVLWPPTERGPHP